MGWGQNGQWRGIDQDTVSYRGQPLPEANGRTILFWPGEAANLELLRVIKPTLLAGTHRQRLSGLSSNGPSAQ